MEYKTEKDGKQEPDYKGLYLDALKGLEEARTLIDEMIRNCKSKASSDYYLKRDCSTTPEKLRQQPERVGNCPTTTKQKTSAKETGAS